MTVRDRSRSMRPPKLLVPRPIFETTSPELPSRPYSTPDSVPAATSRKYVLPGGKGLGFLRMWRRQDRHTVNAITTQREVPDGIREPRRARLDRLGRPAPQ